PAAPPAGRGSRRREPPPPDAGREATRTVARGARHRRAMQAVLVALSLAALAYLALCAALFAFQRSLLYFPPPSPLGARDTTISLPATDARVVASVRPRAGADAVV